MFPVSSCKYLGYLKATWNSVGAHITTQLQLSVQQSSYSHNVAREQTFINVVPQPQYVAAINLCMTRPEYLVLISMCIYSLGADRRGAGNLSRIPGPPGPNVYSNLIVLYTYTRVCGPKLCARLQRYCLSFCFVLLCFFERLP